MIRAIVTDIEGTTSSIRFVHDVLFPYAAKAMPGFLDRHADEPEVRKALLDVAQMSGLEVADREDCLRILQQWMREDRKATPLKTLQGMIWKRGYESGDFRGHVYDDVAPSLAEWEKAGLRLFVYSSGSVPAQQLLFRFSSAGDLTRHFEGYFDTRIGHKRERQAYEAIAEQIHENPAHILFLSDVPAELEAAAAAGYQVCQLRRDDSAEAQTTFPVAETFAELPLP